MTFYSYYTEIKQILGIEVLTTEQAKYSMTLYLLRTPTEKAANKMKEKMK